MWVYKIVEHVREPYSTEIILAYAVGFYKPDGNFYSVETFNSGKEYKDKTTGETFTAEEAAKKLVHYLNGGS